MALEEAQGTQKSHTVCPAHRLLGSQDNIGKYVVTTEPVTACRLEINCLPWLQSSFLQAFIDKSDLSVLWHVMEEIYC